MDTHTDDWPIAEPPFGILRRYPTAGVFVATLALCGLVALVDYAAGQRLSCLLFYLIPVALAAWWGGFSCGILLSVAAAALRHLVQASHGPAEPPIIYLWDATVHFGIFTLSSSLVSRLRVALVRERALARTDPLTGTANGRTFYDHAEQEVRRSERTGRALTLAYLDIDNFKAVNDRLGHPAGDDLLRQVADVIQRQTRAGDLVARLGGDEFAVLLAETDPVGAASALPRLRDTLMRRVAARGWPVSFSIGAATFLRPPCDVDALVRHVDGLMYRVKHGGKNRLIHETVTGPLPAPGAERRAAVRLLCGCEVRVRFGAEVAPQERPATVRDISTGGVGLWLEQRLADDTLVTVEPLRGPRVKTLLARVRHASAQGHGWLHGCELASHLSAQELSEWLPGRPVPDVRVAPCASDLDLTPPPAGEPSPTSAPAAPL
jgi:diguanylate cyclase (GGDEF)-like protein